MNIVGQTRKPAIQEGTPALRPGETVRVHVKVVEGEKERTQVFEGIVIGIGGHRQPRHVHRAQDLLWSRRRAYLPDPFPAHRQSRSGFARQSAAGKTLLFAGAIGQGRSAYRARSIRPTDRFSCRRNISVPIEGRAGVNAFSSATRASPLKYPPGKISKQPIAWTRPISLPSNWTWRAETWASTCALAPITKKFAWTLFRR